MAFTFHHRGTVPVRPSRVALFPGAWNPPTAAHLALARAGLEWADEVVWVIPEAFPHKAFEGVALEERLEMLRLAALSDPKFSVATTGRGLYLEMAEEAREWYGIDPEIGLICGRDAAERIAAWDYGRPGVFEEMLALHPLLVAGRRGDYSPELRHAARIIPLQVEGGFDEVSSTEVRGRISRGEEWESLVPARLVEHVRRLYSR